MSTAAAIRLSARPSSPEYYWPHARGNVGRYSMAAYTAPANLTAALSWKWHHPEGKYHTVVVSAPLLDDKKNIYIASSDGVRKFSPDGTELWYYRSRGDMAFCPSLMRGAVYGSTQLGWVFALDMDTGKERWAERKALYGPTDTGYLESHDGIVVAGVDSGPGGGAMRVLGINGEDGKTIWEYKSTSQLWNIMPLFPGDDSFIVMNIHGGVLKHALHNGTLLWKTSPPEVSAESFSDGGVMIGPDGTSYTCSNYQGSGQQGEHGALRAYSLQDGKLMWDRFLPYPCNSWPVITPDGSSVIVPTGAFVASPAAGTEAVLQAAKKSPEWVHNFSLFLGNNELKAYGLAEKTASINAYDTRTGEPRWSTELPPYGRLAARGDEEGFLVRRSLGHRDQCLPAQFGAPTISADGTIYVGRADGFLYAVGSGTGKFSTFDAEAGFLHPGTSWAPGMMAVTTCDGLYVWNY